MTEPKPETPIAERLMKSDEAAEYLGFSPLTVRRMACKGLLPCYAFPCGNGKFIRRFKMSELVEFVASLHRSAKRLAGEEK